MKRWTSILLTAPLITSLLHTLASGSPPSTPADIVLQKKLAGEPSGHDRSARIHTVRKGDSLSVILSDSGFPLVEMDWAIGRTLELNPSISNPELIYPGQDIILPHREKAASPPSPAASERDPREQAASRPEEISPSLGSLREEGKLLPLLDSTFRRLNEEFSAEGSLTIPLSAGGAVSLDSGIFPLLDLTSGQGLILDVDNRLPGERRQLIEERWPNYRVVDIPPRGDFSDLLDVLLSQSGFHRVLRNKPLSIGTANALSLSPDFLIIKTPDSLLEENLYLVNVLPSPTAALPSEITFIAREHRITVIEILPVAASIAEADPHVEERFNRSKKLTASDYRALIAELAPSLGLSVEGKPRSFFDEGPDNGRRLERKTELLLKRGGRFGLISFQGIAPRDEQVFEKHGISSLEVHEDDPFSSVLDSLLKIFGYDYSGPSVEFYRPDERFAISVPGFYLVHEEQPFLITGEVLNSNLANFLSSRGIEIITCIIERK